MEKTQPPTRWDAEIKGGVLAGLVNVPTCIGLGAFAFSPLGPTYVGAGVFAGLACIVLVQAFSMLLGANSAAISGVKTAQAFIVATAIGYLISLGLAAPQTAPLQTLGLIFFVLAVAGLLQALFAAAGLGALIGYVPYPVLAGFQNGAAISLLLSQIGPLLGVGSNVQWFEPYIVLHAIKPLSAAIGVAGIAAIVCTPRFTRRIPGTIVGLALTCALHYACLLAGWGGHLGDIVGEFSAAGGGTALAAQVVATGVDPAVWAHAPQILALAASIAFINTLDVLLSAKVTESMRPASENAQTVLGRLGVASGLAAFAGALPGTININPTTMNFAAGGRSRTSGIAAVAFVVALVFGAPILISLLPKVALASLLLMSAWSLFDRWSMKLIFQARAQSMDRRQPMLVDLLIVICVAALILLSNLVLAVAIGIFISVISFLYRASRSVVRNSYRCDGVHSRKSRERRLADILEREGRRIAVIELEGPLFFGSADRLSREMASAARDGADSIILDFRRVGDLDTTGARLLVQAADKLLAGAKTLSFCGVSEGSRVHRIMEDTGLLTAEPHPRAFPDADHAIEWAEDRLLERFAGARIELAEVPLENQEIFQGFDETDLEAVRQITSIRTYRQGEVMVHQGDAGRELYVISKGEASVRLRMKETGREIRVITFSAGTIFGELALLDATVRAATVRADTEVRCRMLALEGFEALSRTHPQAAIKLTRNIARELAGRLRNLHKVISELDK
jgi:SulP family sulfate permease